MELNYLQFGLKEVSYNGNGLYPNRIRFNGQGKVLIEMRFGRHRQRP